MVTDQCVFVLLYSTSKKMIVSLSMRGGEGGGGGGGRGEGEGGGALCQNGQIRRVFLFRIYTRRMFLGEHFYDRFDDMFSKKLEHQ